MIDSQLKLKGLSAEETAKIVPSGTVLLSYRGSIAHGMYVPNSDPNSIDDKDLMGFCIPEDRFYFGLSHLEQVEVKHNEWDSVVYEIRKFTRLVVQQNPNVLSTLWNEDKYNILVESAGRQLLDNRHLFVSRQSYHSFTGYAYGQLKKMTALAFQGYMGEKRKKLVEKYGYDTKNAAHLIRILRMGIEFMNEGILYVDRGAKGDAPQLLAIKRGEWTLEQVKAEADSLFKRAEAAYDNCKLPPKVDTQRIDGLITEIVRGHIMDRNLRNVEKDFDRLAVK